MKIIKKRAYSAAQLKEVPKMMRFVLQFDGSVTSMIENLSGKLLQVRSLTQARDGTQVKREVELGVEGVPLLYSQSLWSQKHYDAVMVNKNQPIGKNLLELKLETFREIMFIGQVTLQVNDHLIDTYARKYSVRNRGEVICEIDEYFTMSIMELFRPE